MSAHYYWERVDGPGLEHCATTFASGLRADGVVLGVCEEGSPFRIRYRLDTDDAFHTRSVRVDRFGVDVGDETDGDSLVLTTNGSGSWTLDDRPATHLDGCLDVDVAVTPLTNTLPIRRLALDPEESVTIDVAYLDPVEFEVSATRQRYTCLARGDAGARYRYEGVESGFTAELMVDDAGVVRDYPGLFRRVD